MFGMTEDELKDVYRQFEVSPTTIENYNRIREMFEEIKNA